MKRPCITSAVGADAGFLARRGLPVDEYIVAPGGINMQPSPSPFGDGPGDTMTAERALLGGASNLMWGVPAEQAGHTVTWAASATSQTPESAYTVPRGMQLTIGRCVVGDQQGTANVIHVGLFDGAGVLHHEACHDGLDEAMGNHSLPVFAPSPWECWRGLIVPAGWWLGIWQSGTTDTPYIALTGWGVLDVA